MSYSGLDVHAFMSKEVWGMPVYFWLVLTVVGFVNDLVQRNPKIRAMSLFQIPMNILKSSPLGRMPLIGAALEKLDTPEPTKVVEAAKPEEPKEAKTDKTKLP